MALKIACGQIEIIAGRPDLNTKKILHHMDMACQNGIDILLLPELAVPGYFLAVAFMIGAIKAKLLPKKIGTFPRVTA